MVCVVRFGAELLPLYSPLNPKQAGGRGAQAGSSLCCAETVSSKKIKLCDFYLLYTNKLSF